MNRPQVYSVFMSNADEYRRLAEEARKLAEAMKESAAKAMYEQLARSWAQLADNAERQAGRSPLKQ